jgi:hypothetical protein
LSPVAKLNSANSDGREGNRAAAQLRQALDEGIEQMKAGQTIHFAAAS